MAYRNGTYIAFHGNDTRNPAESDMKFYNTMRMWKVRDDNDFTFVNSHEKTGAVRDTSKKKTLRDALISRMNDSKQMVLIIGETTRFDTDWVPFEIEHAIDKCEIPIIAAYTGYVGITDPAALYHLWPAALEYRINANLAKVIHVPFRQEPLMAAVKQFDLNNPPEGPLTYYTRECYVRWGLMQ